MVCQVSSGRLEQTSKCVVDSHHDGKSPSASAPTAMCGPAREGLKGLAAGGAGKGMPRECLPATLLLWSFLLLFGHECLPGYTRSSNLGSLMALEIRCACRSLQVIGSTCPHASAGDSATSASRCTCWDERSLDDPCLLKPCPNDEFRHGQST